MAAPLETETMAGQTSAVATGNTDFGEIGAILNQCPDYVFIRQPVRRNELLMEMFCGCEVSNFYEVLLPSKDSKEMLPLFDLREQSNFCLRQCCKASHPLVLSAVPPGAEDPDESNLPLFVIDKPYRWCGLCCVPATNCCGRSFMEVMVGGRVLGSVQELCLCSCNYGYNICDENDEVLCVLTRFFCYCECSKDVTFHIMTPDGEETGCAVTKKMGDTMEDFLREMFTTSDNFLVQFPEFMKTTQRKLLLICAAMMVEFKHFNQKKDGDDTINPLD